MTRISINLLGLERKEALGRPSIPIDRGWLIAIVLILASGSLSLIGYTLIDGAKKAAEERKANLEAEIKKLDVKLKEVNELEAQRASLRAEEKILLYVTGETYKWSYFLQEMRALMPLTLHINDLTVSADGAFKLNGDTEDHRTVALFLSNLQNSKLLSTAKLVTSTKSGERTQFSIDCRLVK